MPLPARLKHHVEFTPALLAEVNSELLARRVPCELPECPGQAVYPYRNDRSVIYVCEAGRTRIESTPKGMRVQLDKKLSETAFEGLLRKSYVHLNNASGFELERLVGDYQQEMVRAERSSAQTENQKRAQIRKALRASASQIGMPDEELIASRDRHDLRRKRGESVSGPAPKDKVVKPVPTAHLVTNLPRTADPAVEASLPFPHAILLL